MIGAWSPPGYRDAKFLFAQSHHRDDRSIGTGNAAPSMPSRLAIARGDHHRSRLADTTLFEKDSPHVLGPPGESAHRIECLHAFRLAKRSENDYRIATLVLLCKLLMI